MKSKIFTKKVYRHISQSANIKPDQDRSESGFAYTIIPVDIDRDDYLKSVYQTGYAMVITRDNEVYRDVLIPRHLIDVISFPQNPGEYGDLISWINSKTHNQLSMVGIFNKPGQYHPYLENIFTERFKSDSFEIIRSIDGDVPLYLISVDGEDEESGGIELKAKNKDTTSRVRINVDGTINVVADNTIDFTIENKLQIQLGTEEGKVSTLSIAVDGGLEYKDQFGNVLQIIDGESNLKTPKVNLGKANQSMMLGDTWKNLESAIIDAIGKITVPTALGPSGVPINTPEFIAIKQQLKTALSKAQKVE